MNKAALIAIAVYASSSLANPQPYPTEPAVILSMIQGKWSKNEYGLEVVGADVFVTTPANSHKGIYVPGLKMAEKLNFSLRREPKPSDTHVWYISPSTICHHATKLHPSNVCQADLSMNRKTGELMLKVGYMAMERKK